MTSGQNSGLVKAKEAPPDSNEAYPSRPGGVAGSLAGMPLPPRRRLRRPRPPRLLFLGPVTGATMIVYYTTVSSDLSVLETWAPFFLKGMHAFQTSESCWSTARGRHILRTVSGMHISCVYLAENSGERAAKTTTASGR